MNRDGKLSAAEFEKMDKNPEKAQAKFKQIDADQDGAAASATCISKGFKSEGLAPAASSREPVSNEISRPSGS
jgi:hypothetical protein